MSSRLRWILLGVGLMCLLAGVIVFRQFIYANVIMPISLILWAVLRVFMTIDQEFYWVALVFIAFIFGLSLVPMRTKVLSQPAGRESRQPAKRLEYWDVLIDKAGNSREDQQTLRKNLQELFVNVMAIEDQADPNSIREDLQRKRLDIPKEIVTYLFAVEDRGFNSKRNKQSWINRLLSRDEISRNSSNDNLPDIEAVLDFLETYAEIGYDHEYNSKN
jgi:hypothetical protein